MRKIDEILKQYDFYDKNIKVIEFGNGNINKTYLVKKDDWYIVQKINGKVFKKPQDVIYNINLLNQYTKINNKNITVIELVTNKNGSFLSKCKHTDNDYFRCYKYINSKIIDKDRISYNHLYEAGKIIGTFINEFNELDYRLLKETIPNFHNTKLRYDNFNGKQPMVYHEAIKSFYDLYSEKSDSKYVAEYRLAASEGVKSQKNRDSRYNAIKAYVDEKVKQL